MSDRLPSGVLVGAVLRRVNDAGGIGTVLAKGDAQGGAILVIVAEKGRGYSGLEVGLGMAGGRELIAAGPQNSGSLEDVTHYWQRRRRMDPDLWVIELDIPNAERFAAETIIGA